MRIVRAFNIYSHTYSPYYIPLNPKRTKFRTMANLMLTVHSLNELSCIYIYTIHIYNINTICFIYGKLEIILGNKRPPHITRVCVQHIVFFTPVAYHIYARPRCAFRQTQRNANVYLIKVLAHV